MLFAFFAYPQVVMMSGSGTAFFCLGHPHNRDEFTTIFPAENDVKVFEAMFHGRRFPDMWYFEQPPITAKKEQQYSWE